MMMMMRSYAAQCQAKPTNTFTRALGGAFVNLQLSLPGGCTISIRCRTITCMRYLLCIWHSCPSVRPSIRPSACLSTISTLFIKLLTSFADCAPRGQHCIRICHTMRFPLANTNPDWFQIEGLHNLMRIMRVIHILELSLIGISVPRILKINICESNWQLSHFVSMTIRYAWCQGRWTVDRSHRLALKTM